MGLLIDSSLFIAAERGHLSIERVIAGQEDEPLALSAVTASELLHGVYRAADPARRLRREQFVEAILRQFPVVEFDLEAARIHARLWAQLAADGKQIGAHDLLIAATAIALDFQVATADARDFPQIPDLRFQLWRRS
ncbi:MAG: type II toxin-antitoxin system VapC family toxin [Candidatus Methylomirabilis oxyfera]|nr:type II toxin-antitoxin system VapC family toxin [Candidatus Methylomirabilis oxyfera]